MDVVVDDQGLRRAAGDIEDALYQLSAICGRVLPLLKQLERDKALASGNLNEKYGGKLYEHVKTLQDSIQASSEGLVGDVAAFVERIDEIDSFVY